MNEFYCGGCGRFKKIELKAEIRSKRSYCKSCIEKSIQKSKKSSQAKTKYFADRNAKKYKNDTIYIPEQR